MNCGCESSMERHHSRHQMGCCCSGNHGFPVWSRKKKIRTLEAKLEKLNDQKRDLEELIDEIKEQQ